MNTSERVLRALAEGGRILPPNQHRTRAVVVEAQGFCWKANRSVVERLASLGWIRRSEPARTYQPVSKRDTPGHYSQPAVVVSEEAWVITEEGRANTPGQRTRRRPAHAH